MGFDKMSGEIVLAHHFDSMYTKWYWPYPWRFRPGLSAVLLVYDILFNQNSDMAAVDRNGKHNRFIEDTNRVLLPWDGRGWEGQQAALNLIVDVLYPFSSSWISCILMKFNKRSDVFVEHDPFFKDETWRVVSIILTFKSTKRAPAQQILARLIPFK